MSHVERVIKPKLNDLGDNFVVRRALPFAKKRMVGPFIFWDHMGPVDITSQKPMVVRAHPHIGLSTITYLFSGEILHRDSLGNEQMIRPGEVNWMTAGSGIAHSERAATDSTMRLEGIQLWLALPTKYEQVDPSFVHIKESELPIIQQSGVSLRLIAGSLLDRCSPLPVFSDLFYLHATCDSNSVFELQLKAGQEAAVYVISGKLGVEGNAYEKYDLVCFKEGGVVSFSADEPAEVMLFGGEIFPEGRHIWWNYVASSKDLIEQAKDKWKNREFPEVVNETEFIPLPES